MLYLTVIRHDVINKLDDTYQINQPLPRAEELQKNL